jgi:hypothetical protein
MYDILDILFQFITFGKILHIINNLILFYCISVYLSNSNVSPEMRYCGNSGADQK